MLVDTAVCTAGREGTYGKSVETLCTAATD